MIKNPLFQTKKKLGLYQVVLTTPQTSFKNLRPTVVVLQQVPDIEKTKSNEEISCINWTIYNDVIKVCVNFQTGTDKFNAVVCRYRKSLYLKDDEVDLNETKYQSLWAKWVQYWATIIYSTSTSLYWMKKLFIIRTISVKNECTLSIENFPIVPAIESVIWTTIVFAKTYL